MRTPALRLLVTVAWAVLPLSAEPVAAEPLVSEPGRPITVTVRPVSLDGPAGDRLGRLRYLSGLHLTSDDEDFGGFSGLAIHRGRLTAVSDQGHWLTAVLLLDSGVLKELRSARMGSLCDDDGTPVAWERRDAEEIQALPGGGFLISFERHHRIFFYGSAANGTSRHRVAAETLAPDGRPAAFPFPPAIVPTRRNKGMEAIALLPDGRLLTFAEDLRTIEDDIIGWIGHPEAGDWRHLTLATLEDFLPTGAAVLPAGDVVLLERSYSKEIGNRVRLMLLEAASLLPEARLQPIELARLEPPATVDNMEAVAVHPGPDGETLIYLMSDDNYNEGQRTLLMQFELVE